MEYSIREACEIWGISYPSVQHAIHGYKRNGKMMPPRFQPNEWRKSGTTYLVSDAGMHRVFGEPGRVRKTGKPSSTGISGISFSKSRKTYRAYVYKNGGQIMVMESVNLQECVDAQKKAKEELAQTGNVTRMYTTIPKVRTKKEDKE